MVEQMTSLSHVPTSELSLSSSSLAFSVFISLDLQCLKRLLIIYIIDLLAKKKI